MTELLDLAWVAIGGLGLNDLLDILLVALICYWLLSLIQGTTAMALLRGIVLVLVVGSAVSWLFGLTMLGWLLRNAILASLVAIPILFQPELRRALEQVGRARGFVAPVMTPSQRAVDVIASAADELSERRWGAIIVLERQIPLGEYAGTGVHIDGSLSVEFLLAIFYPKAPLHDGAAIVRGDRVMAAGCVLPLADTIDRGQQHGTRHRAAIGITRKTDAVSVVVSEETGRISICNNGRLVTDLSGESLRRLLPNLYRQPGREGLPHLLRLRLPIRVP
jgi:diadenylate cyclase